MKTLLILLSTLSFSFSAITVGGYVPLTSTISCIQENSEPSDTEVLLATCVVNNNSPTFSVKFKFGFTSEVTELRVHGGEGTLGVGLDSPNYQVDGVDEYIWAPGTQQAATLDYVVRFYGKINSHVYPFIDYVAMENNF